MARKRQQTVGLVGRRIEQRLGRRSQAWLCEQTGIPKQTMNNVVVRGAMPGADKAVRIARALGVSVEWLIEGGPDVGIRPTQVIAPKNERPLTQPAAPEKPSFSARIRNFLRGLI